MNETSQSASERSGIPSVLRQFARRRISTERCELCSAEVSPVHSHLLEPAKRQVLCACEACTLLFAGRTGANYLRIPRRVSLLVDFQISDIEWEALMIPINLAFFYRDSASSRMVAMYPSPAGATESLPHRAAGVLSEGDGIRVQAGVKPARFLLLAAKPLREPVVQYGPFVMNTREEIEQALADYRNGRLAAAA